MRRALLAILIAATLAVQPAFARSLSAEQVRVLVERGEILALEIILKQHEAMLQGRIIKIELEFERGLYIYEIKVLGPDGRTREIKFNARTGEVVRAR